MSECAVLVVDDDPSIRDLIAEALEMEGYQVERAGDGAEAVALLERYIPTVVLLDMRMPVLDGWETAQVLRARRPDSRVVVMTAAQEAGRWAAEINAASYLAKPFGMDELLETVARECAVSTTPA